MFQFINDHTIKNECDKETFRQPNIPGSRSGSSVYGMDSKVIELYSAYLL